MPKVYPEAELINFIFRHLIYTFILLFNIHFHGFLNSLNWNSPGGKKPSVSIPDVTHNFIFITQNIFTIKNLKR